VLTAATIVAVDEEVARAGEAAVVVVPVDAPVAVVSTRIDAAGANDRRESEQGARRKLVGFISVSRTDG
jgi:hypothetical protein